MFGLPMGTSTSNLKSATLTVLNWSDWPVHCAHTHTSTYAHTSNENSICAIHSVHLAEITFHLMTLIKLFWMSQEISLPLLFSELGQYSGSSSEVALSIVVLPHQVKHSKIVRLSDNVLLQVRLQKHGLDLPKYSIAFTASAGECFLVHVSTNTSINCCL